MTKHTTSVLLFLLVGGLLFTTTALTAASQGYDLSWWTVDGGGGSLSIDGGYLVNGSLGQPDAGELASNDYVLSGGFWGGGVFEVYLPLVRRDF